MREIAFIDGITSRGLTALAAAKQAGYRSPQNASFRLMRAPLVSAEIERRRTMLQERGDVDLLRVQKWSWFAATFDIGGIFKPGTFEILPLEQWPDRRLTQLVESIKTTKRKDGTVMVREVKFSPRSPHLNRLLKILGVPKKVPTIEQPRPIPQSVIDDLTADNDRPDRASIDGRLSVDAATGEIKVSPGSSSRTKA